MSKVVIMIACSCILLSCAKPIDPESLVPGNGGYVTIGRFQTPAYAHDVEVKDTLAYLVQGEGGVVIVNVADRTHPKLVSYCQEGVRGYSTKLAVKGTAVFVAAGGFGVSVVDVTDPLVPVATVSNLSIKPAEAFHVFGDYLFTSISELGVKISDVSYPYQPDQRGNIQTPGYAQGMCSTTDSSLLLVACGEMGLAMSDVSEMLGGFGDYRIIHWVDTPGYAVDVATKGSEPVAFVACGTAGVQVVDFSDSANVRIVGSYNTGGYAKEIAYRNNRVYVATNVRGLQVLSVENPASPRLIGVVPTEYAMAVAVDDRYVYIADKFEGLVIASIPQ